MQTYQQILVPLDGSVLAERALPTAIELAKTTQAKLTLLRAVEPLPITIQPSAHLKLSEQDEKEAAVYLQETVQRLASKTNISIETQLVRGEAAAAILYAAKTGGVDLIVMTTHGRTGAKRWFFGSVTEKVLRQAPSAMLIIRAHEEATLLTPAQMPYRILVPLDGSHRAEQALIPAATFANLLATPENPAAIVLLHVVSLSADSLNTPTETFEQMKTAEMEAASHYLDKVLNKIEVRHVIKTADLSSGDVAAEIVDYAAKHHVDLIAMSSHGRSGVEHWVYGSVTEKVLRHAPCATLVTLSAQAAAK